MSVPKEWWQESSIAQILNGQQQGSSLQGVQGFGQGATPIGNTGFNTPGQNNPSAPRAVIQTATGPVALHEGEPLYQRPDGSTQVVSQGQLQQQISKNGIPGMDGGGIIPPSQEDIDRQAFVNNQNSTNSKIAGTMTSGSSKAPFVPGRTVLNKDGTPYNATTGTTTGGTNPLPAPKTTSTSSSTDPLAFEESVMSGNNPLIQNTYQKALNTQGGIGAATLSAQQQQLAQQGVTGTAAGTLGQVMARDLSGQQAQMGSQLAQQAANKQIEAAPVVSQMQAEALTKASSTLSGIVQAGMNTAGYKDNWQNDPATTNALKALWDADKTENPNGAAFDMNDPSVSAWAKSQMDKLTVNSTDATINRITGADWFKNLPVQTQEAFTKSVLPALATLTATGVGSLRVNKNGSYDLVDANGGSIMSWDKDGNPVEKSTIDPEVDSTVKTDGTNSFDWTTDKGKTDAYNYIIDPVKSNITWSNVIPAGGSSGITAYAKANGNKLPTSEAQYNTWLRTKPYDMANVEDAELGINYINDSLGPDTEATPALLKMYLVENDGKMPTNKTAWENWNKNTGDVDSVTDWLNGLGTTDTLGKNENTTLIKMVDAGVVPSLSDSELTDLEPNMAWEYHEQGNDGYHQLTPDARAQMKALSGKAVKVDGTTYIVDRNGTMSFGTTEQDGKNGIRMEGINVYNTKTGQWQVMVFDRRRDGHPIRFVPGWTPADGWTPS
jgi:hypothetical protein